MYDFHFHFWITYWGCEWERIYELQNCALWVMMNSKYNAHREPYVHGARHDEDQRHIWWAMIVSWYEFVKTNCRIFISLCLYITMNYMKWKPTFTLCSIYIPFVPLVFKFLIYKTLCFWSITKVSNSSQTHPHMHIDGNLQSRRKVYLIWMSYKACAISIWEYPVDIVFVLWFIV